MISSASPSLLQLFNPWPIVANLWRHRELLRQFTLREIHIRHKGSQLGILWTLINPLSMLLLFGFVFRLLLKSGFGLFPNETNYDYTIALFLSLSLFHIFGETLSWSPSLIAANPNFVKKVVFPLEVLPVAKIGDTAFHVSVSLALVVVGSAFGTSHWSWSLLWLPVLVLPLLMLALGLAWTLASVGVFVRDVTQAVAFTSTAAMYGSAVVYPVPLITHDIYRFLRFNPILQMEELARQVLLAHHPMNWSHLGYVYACGFFVLLSGHACFSLLRRSFAEVI